MASRELNIVIKAKNLASAAIKGVKADLHSLQKDIGRGFANAGRNIERGIGIGVAAAAGGLAYAVKQAGDFQASLNTINTVAGLSQDQLTAVGDAIRKMARESGTPLEDLTSAYYDLVSAGVSATDAQNVLTQANTLAIGGLGSTAETVDLLTTAINSYGGDASKAKEYTDQFAVAIANGKVTAADLAANFADVGPLAAAMGVGVDQISASIGNMTAKGTHAPEAFTQIRAAMVALQRQTPQLKKVMKQLGIENIQTELDSKGLAGTWDELRKQAEKAGIPLIKLTGRVEGQQYVLQNTGDALDDYNRNLKDVKGASDGAGEAAKQMAERQKGLNFQLDKLKSNAKDAAITLGEAIIPKILPLFEKANAWLATHQPQIKQFAADVADGVAKAVEWASKLDWKGIGNSLKMAADFAKGLVEAFLGMPDWVKQAVITGWGLNKLTGGALGSIVGELGKGLIKGVLGMNAAVVNVKGAVVNVPGGGLPGGGGPGSPIGGGGALSKVASFGAKWGLGPAAAVIIGAEIAKAINDPVIAPAKKFEQDKVTTVLDSNATSKLQAGLDAINAQLNTSDTSAQVALIASRIPIIGDALGNVAPELEKQRDALQKKLDEVKREQAHTSSVTAHSASEHNAVIRQSMIDNSNRVTRQIISHAAGERADLHNLQSATRAVPPALSRIEGVERGNAGRLQSIVNKKSLVVVNLTAISQISIRALAGNLNTNNYTTVTGRRGGALV